MQNWRSVSYHARWNELIEYYGPRCYYCRKEIATTIDHVIPYSWDQDNGIENLVPACGLCNSLASDMIFDCAEHKRQYIMRMRRKRMNMRAICSDCLLPYAYRTHSPSMILCAECYDKEYGTDYSKSEGWRQWIIELRDAGIPAQAHRTMRKRTETWRMSDREARLEVLIDEYTNYFDQDSEFYTTLITA